MRRPRTRNRPTGFTLVELLVVIVILGLLIGLLLPAIMGAVRKAREAAVTAEINVLAQALADFKGKYGEYPPSRIVVAEDGDYTTGTGGNLSGAPALLVPRSLAAFRRYWPRMRFKTDPSAAPVFTAAAITAGNWYDFNGNHAFDAPYVLFGHECLVFFLGGIPQETVTAGGKSEGWGMTGFGKNPLNPMTSATPPPTGSAWPYSGARTTPIHEFKAGQLVPVYNATLPPPGLSFPSYTDSIGSGVPDAPPFAYFSSYGGVGYDPDDVNFAEADDATGTSPTMGGFMASNAPTGSGSVAARRDWIASPSPNPYLADEPIPTTGGGAANTSDTRPRSYQNPNTYQIISPGYDRLYGIGGQYSPKGPVVLPWSSAANASVTSQTLSEGVRDRERDNLTNFATGRLE
jgi:prepilin-type N-terminal cleavage/methylation domain-containing protein